MTNTLDKTFPQRGFAETEYAERLSRCQALMANHGLDAVLLTTQPEFYYFTGYLTRFWESPSRPWYLLIPSSGKPVAVIPSIGAQLMAKTWVNDIRTWRSPDLQDDGVTLLAKTIKEFAKGGKIGIPDVQESHVRMPLSDLKRLETLIEPSIFASDAGIVRQLRLIKSSAEIGKIKTACQIANRAFTRVHEIAESGKPLSQVFRKFQMLCLEEGADWVPYLAGGAGPDGYDDVISPASDKPLHAGDILMLDTGLVWDGYFCDFDRNFAISKITSENKNAYQKLIEASSAAFELAKPGTSTRDLFNVMDKIVTGGKGSSDAGRLGHGLGLQLTEWPSLIPEDETILQEGMVLTLEPGIETRNGCMLVHEENIIVTKNGAEFLSSPAGPDMQVLV